MSSRRGRPDYLVVGAGSAGCVVAARLSERADRTVVLLEAGPGNQLSMMVVSLATDVGDPLERLAAVRGSTASAKKVSQAVGSRNLTSALKIVPDTLVGPAFWLIGQVSQLGLTSGMWNTTVSGLPGPSRPLYLAGAKMVRLAGAGPVVDGMGLINMHGSYCGQFHDVVHRLSRHDARLRPILGVHPRGVPGPRRRSPRPESDTMTAMTSGSRPDPAHERAPIGRTSLRQQAMELRARWRRRPSLPWGRWSGCSISGASSTACSCCREVSPTTRSWRHCALPSGLRATGPMGGDLAPTWEPPKRPSPACVSGSTCSTRSTTGRSRSSGGASGASTPACWPGRSRTRCDRSSPSAVPTAWWRATTSHRSGAGGGRSSSRARRRAGPAPGPRACAAAVGRPCDVDLQPQ